MSRISDSELEVMKILWKEGECTSAKILETLSATSKWSKTTIKTLLSRLVDKGVVKQTKQNGQRCGYCALVSEKEYQRTESENLIAKLYQGSVNHMLLNFVEQKQISKEDLERLLEMIERE